MLLMLVELRPVSRLETHQGAVNAGDGLPPRAFNRARGENTMLKRMILAGVLAATAFPALASQASYETKSAPVQSSTTTAKPDAPKPGCSCECLKHHHS